jgi:hypothetical protein
MPLISFEFTAAFLAPAMRCLDRKASERVPRLTSRTTLIGVIRYGLNMRPG